MTWEARPLTHVTTLHNDTVDLYDKVSLCAQDTVPYDVMLWLEEADARKVKRLGQGQRAHAHAHGRYQGDGPSLFSLQIRAYPSGPYPPRRNMSEVPHANGIVETHVKKVIRGTRALLLHADLHRGWRPYAPRCFAAIGKFVTDDDVSYKIEAPKPKADSGAGRGGGAWRKRRDGNNRGSSAAVHTSESRTISCSGTFRTGADRTVVAVPVCRVRCCWSGMGSHSPAYISTGPVA